MSTRMHFPRALLCLAILTAACESPTRPVARTDTAPSQANVTPIHLLYGNIIVATLPGTHNVLVSVDGGESRDMADGRADYLYLLHRDQASDMGVYQDLRQATIKAVPDGLVILSRDGHTFGLFVKSRVAETRARLGAGDGMPVRSWLGYGLARRSGSWDLPSTNNLEHYKALFACDRAAAPLLESPLVALFSISDCTSGGRGSTSCSTTCAMSGGNCSVSCSDGYYACCRSVGCNCTCQAIELAPNIPG